MCFGGSSGSLSRLGISIGLLSLVTLITAFVSNVWLFTKEPITLPDSHIATTITFKIGFWTVCSSLKRTNTSHHIPSPSCSLVKYSKWGELKDSDLGVFWSTLQFTPAFISKMRFSMPFEAISVVLMLLATMFAFIGHCNSDHKTLVACGLYTLGGLSLAGGLVVFASVLSDVYFDRPRRANAFLGNTPSSFDYRYGWSFFAAGAAFIFAEIAALVSISAYLKRFSSVEDMVRVMVPGAERRLRQHHFGEYLVRRTGYHAQPEEVQKAEALVPSDHEGCEGPLLTSKTQPDICTTNQVNLMTDDVMHLAGTTVPITLMHPRPLHPPHGNSYAFPTSDFQNRYATVGSCTLVHQGVLGVAEGRQGTSSSSGSSASSGAMATSTGSSMSSKSFQHLPKIKRAHEKSQTNVSPSSGYCSGSAV